MSKKPVISSTPHVPIVAVLGHVDHGKTTLLDTIRKTDIAAREHGGITQHIGAYQIVVPSKDKKAVERKITFIDTPGHEAFAKMRSRGATAADLAILVVAADDSVKPQTKESIEQIQKAGIPFIVAVNKIDLPGANVDRVRQDLAKVGVQVEGFGGEIPMVQVSAKSGKGVPELLEMILLLIDMKRERAKSPLTVEAIVVETRIDKGKGMLATLIVRSGELNVNQPLFEGAFQVGKIRAMFTDAGIGVKLATSSMPVEVLGFTSLPTVGARLSTAPYQLDAPAPKLKEVIAGAMPDFLRPLSEIKESLKVVLKTDTSGSLEAIVASLDERVKLVHYGVGPISEQDILVAKSTGSFVIGFNVKVAPQVEKLAQTERVVFRSYTIIYELLDELTEVVSGMKEVITRERELGTGAVIAEFPYDGQRIAGTKIVAGRLARGDQVKVMRGETEIARAKIKSIRHGKDEITKVESGAECGVNFDKKVDFQLEDVIIAITQS